jgi:hypothetical protein
VNAWLSAYGGYFLIPFIAAFAGWGTNWLAIKMTFYPLEYVGKFPFGWRGVVPSRIRKFATGMVDTTIGRIGGLPAMVDAHPDDRRGGPRPDARAAARAVGEPARPHQETGFPGGGNGNERRH